MANLVRNFIKGRMNKSVDERLVPDGEYIHAENIRMGSTEDSEIGAVENTKGNEQLTTLVYPPTGDPLSAQAVCIGAYADGANETMYWFVHDPGFAATGLTGKLDLIVSYNTVTQIITYHVVSIDDGGGFDTTLNFDQYNLVTGVDLVEDLLFFTDDRNPPRRINVTTNYPNPTGAIDWPLLGEDILVIKAPPNNSPGIVPFDSGDEQNTYMEDRLICFAYRYRYANGEYSATSQFSAPSFVAKPFLFTPESFTNEGMENATNACTITYNSGSELVIGIDLLFKEMDDSIIRVIEKLNKDDDGLADNTDYEYVFDNNKIYTILPESEILRLYDNVPLLAKAQTMMGNRLVYGNYTEGYDLLDQYGVPIRLDYFIGQIKLQAGMASVASTISRGTTYNLPPTPGTPNTTVQFTFDDFNFTIGDTIQIELSVSHDGQPPNGWLTVSGFAPTSTTPQSTVTFIYPLTENFSTVAEMVSSASFLEAIGTAANIETTPANYAASDQSIFTNAWNAIFPLTQTGGIPDPQNLIGTGVNALAEPIQVVASSNDSFTLAFPMPQYQSGATDSYESLTITSAVAQYFSIVSQRSLHSNRTYQVGIVYMDEYNRATTVLTSESNTVHIPCGDSIFRNNIRVEIPVWERPPFWADRYKFVIKPDRENYETIYTNIFENYSSYTYFLLEGEQAAKVEKGDRYIVKADCSGATPSCVHATVLDKVSLAVGDLAAGIPAVAGTYMKIKADGFNTTPSVANYDSDWRSRCTDDVAGLQYPDLVIDAIPTGSLPAGSRVTINLEYTRKGTGDGDNSCESRELFFERTYVVDADYSDIVDWFYTQDGVVQSIENEEGTAGDPNACPPTIRVFGPTSSQVDDYGTTPPNTCEYRLTWYQNAGAIRFVTYGGNRCAGLTNLDLSNNRRACVKARIRITYASDLVVFETQPQDVLPDLWYESSVSYDIVGGFHQGNLRNQTALQSALIDTAFFNCITYGNGVESYKIRDSVVGKPITMGNRVTTVSAQDYKQIRRFADLTYSGVYNDETNVNKLNEFNLGLLNFKPLEDSYGPVEKLFGRRTDILTLQEDKISYVLAGKNLLTDSTGESVVTSVPEVLGTQVARVEDYGISNNPESFARYGPHKFFTDAKRGAVIHLYGDSTSEQLIVISENGMRSWFRDMFIENFNTQKLGGYDPYMDEYVLANNDTPLPGEDVRIECGVTQTFQLTAAGESYSVNVGDLVGSVSVVYTVLQAEPGDQAQINALYNGVTTNSGLIGAGTSSSFLVDKNNIVVDTVDININFFGTGRFVVQVTVECPDADIITIRLVTVTNQADAGKTVHNNYRWEVANYVSPLHTQQVKFLNGTNVPLVSQYQQISGYQGGGVIPTDDADVTMISHRTQIDDYILKPTDRFYYLRSTTDYANTPGDISSLLTAAVGNVLVPAGGPNIYTGQFNMSTAGTGQYLYLIWDYSLQLPTQLCFDATKIGACCGCTCDPAACVEYEVYNDNNPNVTFEYTDCDTATTQYFTLGSKQGTTVCSSTYPVVVAGDAAYVLITINECDC